MKYLKIFLAFLLFAIVVGFTHPFFVSVTEIEYSSKTKELGMVVKLYPDDLEETLRKFNGVKYDVIQGDKKILQPILDQYIKKHISIKLNGIKKVYQFIGYEIDKESVLIYFSITNQPAISSIEVESDIMYEYKSEQTNIIHIKLDQKRESYRLIAPDKKVLFKK
jgi:hypothetical protein